MLTAASKPTWYNVVRMGVLCRCHSSDLVIIMRCIILGTGMRVGDLVDAGVGDLAGAGAGGLSYAGVGDLVGETVDELVGAAIASG